MKLLADENVRKRLVHWLNAEDHDVTIAEKGTRNSRLFKLANGEQRILLTNDTDFLNTILYPPADTAGRIVVRVFPPTLKGQQQSLSSLLTQLTDADCQGKLIILYRNNFETRTE